MRSALPLSAEQPRRPQSGPPARATRAPQESTSEAVNGYYAVSLLGNVLGNADLTRWGQLLTAIEVSGAQHYYQITSAPTPFPSIYPLPFGTGKVVGILWNGKVDYTTW